MCLNFKLTGVFLALMLFLVCADRISEGAVPVVVQSTHSPAWCSCRLTDLDAFLDRKHLFCAFQGYCYLTCVFDCTSGQKKGMESCVCSAFCSVFGSTWTRPWKRHKRKLWTFTGLKSSACGVDRNKYGDAGCGFGNCCWMCAGEVRGSTGDVIFVFCP